MTRKSADRRIACPECGYLMDRHEYAEPQPDGGIELSTKEQPGPGDLAICLKCGEPALFQVDGSLRKMTGEEWATLDSETVCLILRCQAARVAVVAQHRERGLPWIGEGGR